MNNKDIYQALSSKQGLRAHSFMGIIPESKDIQFIQSTVFDQLKAHPEIRLHNFLVRELNLNKDPSILNLQWIAEIEFKGKKTTAYFSISKTKYIDFTKMGASKIITTQTLKNAIEFPYFLLCRLLYSENPLDSFLLQLKLMNAIVPKSILVLDFSSNRLLSTQWLKFACSSLTPPSPQYLYQLHRFSTVNTADKEVFWLRTNGLYRCGVPEIEVINLQTGVQQMAQLIHTVASLFTQDKYYENKSFKVGFDGLDMNICWLRWEKALQHYPKDAFGGIAHRQGKKNTKLLEPSGVLLAVEEGLLTSPEIYIPAINKEAMLTINEKELLRQRSLAQERYFYFNKFLKDQKEKRKKYTSSWLFLVHLDSVNQDYIEIDPKDHLWFQVESIQKTQITAQLINTPYRTKNIKKGDIITSIIPKNFINWVILKPDHTEYNPENIYLLSI